MKTVEEESIKSEAGRLETRDKPEVISRPGDPEKLSRESIREIIDVVRGVTVDAGRRMEAIRKLFEDVGGTTARELVEEAGKEYEGFLEGVEKLGEETIKKLLVLGFDVIKNPEEIFALRQRDKIGGIEAAQGAGLVLEPEQFLGQGMSKTVFLLRDGRVLKMFALHTYLGEKLGGEDEVSFYDQTRVELGDEVEKVLAKVESAGLGIPADISELALQTEKVLRLARAAGNTELESRILVAHNSNPLVRNNLFERKTTNTGLVRREDGRIYVVGTDTSGGLSVDHVEGGWDTVRGEMKNIVSLTEEEIVSLPEVRKWLDFVKRYCIFAPDKYNGAI